MKHKHLVAPALALTLTLLLTQACGGDHDAAEVTDAPAPARIATAAPAPTATASPTYTPTPAAIPTSTPQGPTTEAQVTWQPLDPTACAHLANAVASALGVDVATEEAPFQDYVDGKAGTGCQVMATGTGLDFDMTAFDTLKGMLAYEGWWEDVQYGGGGPTGLIGGFRRSAGLCLLTVGWEPSEDTDCPTDQPIQFKQGEAA